MLAVTTIVLSASLLTVILGALIPFVTGLITKLSASSAVKSVCTAILATATGIFTAAQQNGGNIELESALANIIVAFVTAISLYYGLYRPTTASVKVASITGEAGIG